MNNRPARKTAANEGSPLSAQVQSALALFQAGQCDQAEAVCGGILLNTPDCFDAVHLLAVIKVQERQYPQALSYFDRAMQMQPGNPELVKNRRIVVNVFNRARIAAAVALHQKGRLTEAEQVYQAILKLDPDHLDAMQLLGTLAVQRKQLSLAIAFFGKALALKPDYVEAHNNRGIALKELMRLDEALASYDRALALKPDYVEAHNNRGIALMELERLDEALASYDRALAFKPDFAEAHNNRGIALMELERPDEALASYDRALALKPDYVEAHNNRGIALMKLKRPDEALASYDRALALKPDYVEAHNNRGIALMELNRPDEALASYDRALALKPDFAEAHNNRGIALKELERLDEALASYDRALALKPDYVEAHFNESLCHLLRGDFARGWEKYEWRWQRSDRTDQPRAYPQHQWLASDDIRGKTLLLYSEQGYGDTLQFCRYVPQLAALGARIVLEVPKALMTLLAGLEGVSEIIAQGTQTPYFDFHCPLMSMPLAFGTVLADVSGKPYLRVPADKLATWQGRLGRSERKRIGLAWSGHTQHKDDAKRSIPLATLQRFMVDGLDYFCLQKEIRAQDQSVLATITSHASDLKCFADTAALVSLMDVVITIDTSVAHLAGALGKETWVLLPHVPDWRWLLDRDDSPWYDSATLFRQPRIGDWTSVLESVRQRLHDRFFDQVSVISA